MRLVYENDRPIVLNSILIDDYGQLAALTVSEWWDPMSPWFEYVVSMGTMHHVWRTKNESD